MRHFVFVPIALLLVSCDSMPPLWHKATPEEIAGQEERDRSSQEQARARAAERRKQRAERQQETDAVVQAFTLQDVRDCERLALIRKYSLDSARKYAVRVGGNRVLAQRREYVSYEQNLRTSRYERVRLADADDYEVYLCAAPKDPPR